MSSPAACKQNFDALCVVQVEVVRAGPRLHVVYLRHPTVDVCRRDNELGIMCVLAETVARGDRMQVGCSDNVGCGSNV